MNRSSLLFPLALAAVAILQLPAPCLATGIIVPAYFYPGTGGPGGVGNGWAALATAAASVPITAIFDPNSGPASGPADPNYVNAMTNLESAGGKVVAYLNTASDLDEMELQINTYITQYGHLIDGFFLDGMIINPGTLPFYDTLYGFIKGLSSSYTVIGNPGDADLNGVSVADYLSTADIFNLFQGPTAGTPAFIDYPAGSAWFLSYPDTQISNLIYNTPSTQITMDLTIAGAFHSSYVYITDQTTPNPYAQLPSYWDQEVAAIESTPEPGTLTMLTLGSLVFLMPAIGARRRRGRA